MLSRNPCRFVNSRFRSEKTNSYGEDEIKKTTVQNWIIFQRKFVTEREKKAETEKKNYKNEEKKKVKNFVTSGHWSRERSHSSIAWSPSLHIRVVHFLIYNNWAWAHWHEKCCYLDYWALKATPSVFTYTPRIFKKMFIFK